VLLLVVEAPTPLLFWPLADPLPLLALPLLVLPLPSSPASAGPAGMSVTPSTVVHAADKVVASPTTPNADTILLLIKSLPTGQPRPT
jgi:hypothetical protein